MPAQETDKKAQRKIRKMRMRMEYAKAGQERNGVKRTFEYVRGFLKPQTKHQRRWKWLAEKV